MKEVHPFEPFVPEDAEHLILGTFPPVNWSSYGVEAWYYPSTRNQFWKILEEVYHLTFSKKKEKGEFFSKMKIAISDVLLEVYREKNNSSDENLVDVIYNSKALKEILVNNPIIKIYFTSQFAAKSFSKIAKEEAIDIAKFELITLPSPFPRYASMSIDAKIKMYKKFLPKNPRSFAVML